MVVISAVALLSSWQFSWPASEGVVYGSLALLVGILAFSWGTQWRQLKRRLAVTELHLDQSQARMAAAFRLSHHFARAKDEHDVIDMVLENCLEVVGVDGASFVALDLHAQPHPAQVRGLLPGNSLKDWGETVASPHIRAACAACKTHSAAASEPCPLVSGSLAQEVGVHCFPVRMGDIDFGMLNLYLPAEKTIEPEAMAFLTAMLDEMAMAIEAVRLRGRAEHAAVELQKFLKPEFEIVLPSLLQGLMQALGADWAYLYLYENEGCPQATTLFTGNIPAFDLGILDEKIKSLDGSPVSVIRTPADKREGLPDGTDTVLISPLLLPDGEKVGGLAIGFTLPQAFPDYASTIIRAVSSQLAVAAHYAQQVRIVEYQAVLEERTRLAREIHDGLAQTLGFLKLMATQMQGYLERGESDRLADAVELSRQALAEAYLDTREAIDGLRISPEQPLDGWLVQAAEEYALNNDIPVEIGAMEVSWTPPPEIQAQLMRIVQEALTNIRKHARASRVTVGCRMEDDELVLEIQDNGVGFDMRDVLDPARHGLKGMRERAELIDADLQVISRMNIGTLVRVVLPHSLEEALA